jgi:hypothetical protein
MTMDAKARAILAVLMTSVMVLMVTLIATYLNSDLIRTCVNGRRRISSLAGGGNDRLLRDAARAPPDRLHCHFD